MLLVLSLCLYSGAVLVTCLIFLLRTTQQLLYIDKVFAYPPGLWAQVGSGREQPGQPGRGGWGCGGLGWGTGPELMMGGVTAGDTSLGLGEGGQG